MSRDRRYKFTLSEYEELFGKKAPQNIWPSNYWVSRNIIQIMNTQCNIINKDVEDEKEFEDEDDEEEEEEVSLVHAACTV